MPGALRAKFFSLLLQLVEDTCCEDINFQQNPTPNDTNSLPSLKISVETPKIDNTKY